MPLLPSGLVPSSSFEFQPASGATDEVLQLVAASGLDAQAIYSEAMGRP